MYLTIRRLKIFAACAIAAFLTITSPVSAGASAGLKNPLLRDYTFIVFDVETTGLSPEYEHILELGAVKIEGGTIVDKKSWLINPRKRISSGAQNVHGIDYDMVKHQQMFKAQYPEIAEFFGDAILMAHNARFDRDFLYKEVNSNGFPVPENPVVDTLKLFRAWYPDASSHSLGALAAELEIAGGTLHRGLDDSVYAAEIFLKGMHKRGAPRSLKKLIKLGGIPAPEDKADKKN